MPQSRPDLSHHRATENTETIPKAERSKAQYLRLHLSSRAEQGLKSELLRMLQLHEIEFDEQYVFD